MKKMIGVIGFTLIILGFGCNAQPKEKNTKGTENKTQVSATGEVVHLTDALFRTKVFNYETNKEWKYEGDKPCIIDFYADWCGPCRVMSPRLEEIAKEYAGKLVVYKVDTDKEQKLSGSMGITSLPTILFVPQSGQPRASIGIIPKEALVQAIREVLLINK